MFEVAVIARKPDGALLIALMDGRSQKCVALLSCSPETARTMCEAVGSTLKEGQT